jgi:integrase
VTAHVRHEAFDHTVPAKIVFVRDRSNRKKWIAIVCTDTTLSEDEIIALYGKRWDIEPFHKRDYAILTIAKELGVRSCDIANLKLNDIRWESYEICFQQSKTGVELILPLEPFVGNAIAEYILNGRPKTDSQHIFVRSRAPHTNMTRISDIIIRYAPRNRFEKFSGFHSFRRGLLSSLLNAGIPVDTAKNIAGQTRIDSIKPYARISGVRLKSCALNLSGMESTREVLQ